MVGLRCDSCGAPVTGLVCEYCGSSTVQAYNEILKGITCIVAKPERLSKEELDEIRVRARQGAMIRI